MNIKIYEHSDYGHGPHLKELKYEIEIEDSEIITTIRRVLAKGVVGKE